MPEATFLAPRSGLTRRSAVAAPPAVDHPPDSAPAGDGQEALEVAAEFRPHVILMDLGMPGMNGYEAARHIRRQPWGPEVVLTALTGWGQDEDKQRTQQAGFDHHLVKPAEPAELQRLCSRVKSRRDHLPEPEPEHVELSPSESRSGKNRA